MNMDRRNFIRGIGTAICAGAAYPFVPSLLGGGKIDYRETWGTMAFYQDEINSLNSEIMEDIEVYGKFYVTFTS